VESRTDDDDALLVQRLCVLSSELSDILSETVSIQTDGWADDSATTTNSEGDMDGADLFALIGKFLCIIICKHCNCFVSYTEWTQFSIPWIMERKYSFPGEQNNDN
jgi:hypothetical protein